MFFVPLIVTSLHHTITFSVSETLLFFHHKINVLETASQISFPSHHIKATPSWSFSALLFSHQRDIIGVHWGVHPLRLLFFHHKIVALSFHEDILLFSHAIIVILSEYTSLPDHHKIWLYNPVHTLFTLRSISFSSGVAGFTITWPDVI